MNEIVNVPHLRDSYASNSYEVGNAKYVIRNKCIYK